jgi:hypothetical protein
MAIVDARPDDLGEQPTVWRAAAGRRDFRRTHGNRSRHHGYLLADAACGKDRAPNGTHFARAATGRTYPIGDEGG